MEICSLTFSSPAVLFPKHSFIVILFHFIFTVNPDNFRKKNETKNFLFEITIIYSRTYNLLLILICNSSSLNQENHERDGVSISDLN